MAQDLIDQSPQPKQIKPRVVHLQAADSTAKIDSVSLPEPRWQMTVSPFAKKQPLLISPDFPEDKVVVTRDSLGNYLVQRQIMGVPASLPIIYSAEQYKELSEQHNLNSNWLTLIHESNLKQNVGHGLLNFKFNIPGGRKSAFTTIFGKPEVNLRVTGTADMNIGASIQKTADPSLPPSQQRRVDPTFSQNLKLNIQGTIGNKLHVSTDWDTQRPFNYQNTLKIKYTGYNDEILKSVELGNVSMETGNSLIRGGAALFGIKARAKLGPLQVTSVVSQQQGKGNTQTITGGSQTQNFTIRPADYQNNQDFYMNFYAWDQFNKAVSNPQINTTLFNFSNIEVYKLDIGNQNINDPQPAVAIVELGVKKQNGQYLPPDDNQDGLNKTILNQIRNSQIDTIDVSNLAQRLGISNDQDIVKGTWIKLQQGKDYTVNQGLGLLFLKTALLPNEALAVAYDYTDQNGKVHHVGDVQSLGQSVKILKLIRQPNMTSSYSTWKLTMRNIYSLGPTNLTQNGTDVSIYYTGQNTDSQSLPYFNSTLLTDLGLDRVNQDGQKIPDNQIDFIPPVMDATAGRIMFPYRQPFGQRIASLIDSSSSVPNKQSLISNLVFSNLYSEPQEIAKQESQNNIYEIKGSAKGGPSDTYNLGMALVQGSVKVFANGVQLTPGVDYTVDYSLGNIFITNKQYLAAGQQIKIEYESNQLMQVQQTSFTGVRAQYNLSKNIHFGTTYLHMKDKPLTDKIRIGDEPINNSVVGFDADAKFNAPWLTRAIDKIPLLQTKAPSSISFSGEFAQLRPGVSHTNAEQAAIRSGQLTPDEKKGISYIDDFEGSKVSFSLLNPGLWHLAAAPASVPGYDQNMDHPSETLEAKIKRSDLRAQFSWYMLPLNVSQILGIPRTRTTAIVKVTDIFPQKQTLPQESTIQPLDIYYNPTARGPYNYNLNLKNMLEQHPNDMWGGMTTALPDGIENFTINNIEYVEFWCQPILPKQYRTNGNVHPANIVKDYDGNIYVDVGTVSEDVIPNYTSNSEDGLYQLGGSALVVGPSGRSYVPDAPVTYNGQFSVNSLKQEDVGLDGVPDSGGYGGFKNERTLFANFIAKMKSEYGANSPQFKKIYDDPSNDDYDYFGEAKLRREYGTSSIQPYFYRMYGYYEGNSEPPNSDGYRAITNKPDAEGLKIPSLPNYRNSYYEYQINLNPADNNTMQVGKNFIVDKVPDGSHPGDYWYEVRIPLSEFTRAIGGIQNLQNVTHIRIWMSGYSKPFTLRLAKLQLVGSQWRKSTKVGDLGNSNTTFHVSTISIDNNSTRTPVPYREPPGVIRPVTNTQQGTLPANEQSLVLKVHDLRQGDMRMVRRDYSGGLDLLNYSRLRMFVHGEGYKNRNDLELILRIGRDLTNDYYEYRQPITPTDTTLFKGEINTTNQQVLNKQAQEIWLTKQNSVNLLLSVLNELKQLRDQKNANVNALFQDSTLAEENGAPPGTVVGVKGNPSLDKITEIGIGIKNPLVLKPNGGIDNSKGVPSLDGQIWVDELRVTGYNNKKGWAADGSMQMKLADFAQVDASVYRSTAGFGALNSRLGQRQQSNDLSYNITTNVNLQKFIPDRYGWNFPVSFTARRSISTPVYLPTQGDVRLTDFENAVRRRKDLSVAQKTQIINDEINASQTYNQNYSLNISNISKQYSKSKLAKYTLDKTTFSYVYNAGSGHNPVTQYQDNWNYYASANYNLNFTKVGLVSPFHFLTKVPVLNVLSGLKFAYMPSSITASAGLQRQYSESQQRQIGTSVASFQQTHNFDYKSQFGLSYNFLPSIPISFSTSTDFRLNDMGTRPDPLDSTRFHIVPTFEVLKNIIKGGPIKPRRATYNEKYSASWRPALNNIQALSWINYSASYSGGFDWQNTPQGSGLGANLNNNLSLNQSLSLGIRQLFDKLPFFRKIKYADEAATQKRREERLRRKAERAKMLRRAEKGNGNSLLGGDGGGTEQKPKKLLDNLAYLGRKLFLGLFSMQSIDLSYNISASTAQNGYNGGSEFFHMFGGQGMATSPPFLYRVGLMNQLDNYITNPYSNQSLSISANRLYNDNIIIKTRLQPFPNLTIDLNWQTSWNRNRNVNYTLPPGSDLLQNALLNQNGRISSSVWIFGKGYHALLDQQMAIARADINPNDPNIISDKTGNHDGKTVLSPATLVTGFRKAYLGSGSRAIGSLGFTPIPLPGWTIRWSGRGSILPILGRYVQSITLTHRYSGSYMLGWNYYNDAGSLVTGSLGNYTIESYRKAYEANAINLDKQFMPLLGVAINWKNNMTTNLEYDYSKLTSLSFTGPTITDQISKGFKFSFNYTKQGFRIPFLTNKLRNTINMGFTLNYLEDVTIPYKLGLDLQRALSGASLINNASDIMGDARVQASTIIGYQFSSTIKANFEYTYQHLMPKSSQTFERTDQEIKFNIIVSIRSN